MADWINELSFAQRQRLQFIESLLIWDGSVQRGEVCQVFNVTPNHLTRDIKRYRTFHKGALEYDVESRAYRRGSAFTPLFASGSAEEYLALLQASGRCNPAIVLPAMGHVVPFETLLQPLGLIQAEVLRAVIHALRSSTGLSVTYQSFSEPSPTERMLWPHTLVFNGERWHVRAFDGRKNEFRDFVLARFLSAELSPRATPSPIADDSLWEETEVLEIAPAPYLSATQKKVVAREYGMTTDNDGNPVWRITLRKCLIGYFLIRHRLEYGGSLANQPTQGQHPYLALQAPENFEPYRFTLD